MGRRSAGDEGALARRSRSSPAARPIAARTGSAGTSTTPRDGGTLRFSTKDTLRTLDPAIAYDDVAPPILHAIYDTLVDYEPARAGDLTSGLASCRASPSAGRSRPTAARITFWLRAGIAYEDGRPIVAADFKTSLERVLAHAGLAVRPVPRRRSTVPPT